MAVERIIGIDIGTSTSVVKIKTYRDNKPLDAIETTDYIRFDNKDTIPTLVYKTAEGRFLIGYEAENAAVKGELCQNFKIDLLHPDPTIREEAVYYTDIFLKYLYNAYCDQKVYYPACDNEITYISYPAKWPEQTRDLMIRLTEKAGFKNVCGLDEPTAAIHTVMVQESSKIQLNNNYANILMIDMGAGTTDLVLCRYSPYERNKITLLNVWPKADSPILFGGREIDEVLCEYVKAYLVNCGLPNAKNFREKYLDKCKTWKENNVSPTFKDKNGVVRYCGFIDTLTAMMDTDIEFPPLSRDDFENMFQTYLSQFVSMVNDCLEDANLNRNDLDYVILTGGHSQWYFTNEMLCGTLIRFGRIDLPKIQAENNRVIKLSRPQETVALGLVYQKISIQPAKTEDGSRDNYFFCSFCGMKMTPDMPYCPNCNGKKDPGVNQTAVISALPKTRIYGNGDRYLLPRGKNLNGLTMTINNLLQNAHNMETQTVNLENGDVMIQARDKGGKWKQFLGMDKAITVKIEKFDDNSFNLNIGEAKWADKVGVMAVSMFILWPLSVTSGIGMFMQGKLPGEIKKAVSNYVNS
jgi:molecular chaperone DnaK (HSP70)